MKLLISIYFFILAIIQMGLFFGVYHYYRTQSLVKPNTYWMSSLLTSVVGLLVFGSGIVTLTDIKNPQFNFTIANTLFYAAAVLQALFCQSLVKPISKKLKIGFGIRFLIFRLAVIGRNKLLLPMCNHKLRTKKLSDFYKSVSS